MTDSNLRPHPIAPPPEGKKPRTAAKVIDFTEDEIKKIPLPVDVNRVEYKDSKVNGLYLRITRQGVKTFSYVGRPKGSGRTERKTLGKHPVVKAAEARNAAKRLSGHQASGDSVTVEDRTRREEWTLNDLWKEYDSHISQTKTHEAIQQLYGNYLEPKWGNKRLSEIKKVDVEKWHANLPTQIVKQHNERAAAVKANLARIAHEKEERRQIRKHGPAPRPKPESVKPKKEITGHTNANRVLELLRAIFNFGIDDSREYFNGKNPTRKIKRFQEYSRTRFLKPNELGPFFQALGEMTNHTVRDAISVAIFTGQRRANVFGMQWSHIDLVNGEWTIPGNLTKNNEQHVTHLIPEIMEILKERHKTATSDFVFPSELSESGHIISIAKPFKQLLMATKVENLIFHDLRRTLGSWLARGGASLLLIGKVLNHKSPEATAIYAMIDRDPINAAVGSASNAMFVAGGLKPSAEVIELQTKPKARSRQAIS
jgi:integrase